MEWMPIETAPLGVYVLLFQRGWRHAFPGKVYDAKLGGVVVDTCEPKAAGWDAYATHWMPLPEPPKGD